MTEFNEQILLVLRWLQNKDSVSEEELRLSYTVAYTAADTVAYTAADTAADDAAACASADAYAAARYAAYAAAWDAASGAEIWLNKAKKRLNEYFRLTKKDRGAYEERAKYLNVLGVNNAYI